MRLPADWASSVSSTSESRVTPTPAVLADGDTGLGRGSTNEALVAENDDALVDKALGTGTLLGVPNVEVGRSGSAAVGLLDDSQAVREVNVDVQWRRFDSVNNVAQGCSIVASVAIPRNANNPEVGLRLRETCPEFLGEVGIGGVEPSANDIEVFLGRNLRRGEGPAPSGVAPGEDANPRLVDFESSVQTRLN